MNIHEAKTHFSKLIARVLEGEEVVISKAGVPVARLVPFVERRPMGFDAGKVELAPDFDAPLPDSLLDAFEGVASAGTEGTSG